MKTKLYNKDFNWTSPEITIVPRREEILILVDDKEVASLTACPMTDSDDEVSGDGFYLTFDTPLGKLDHHIASVVL